jgi:hypothetical protein
MTARVLMLLKSRASLTCFRACFLPGRAKDLSAPRYSYTAPSLVRNLENDWHIVITIHGPVFLLSCMFFVMRMTTFVHV